MQRNAVSRAVWSLICNESPQNVGNFTNYQTLRCHLKPNNSLNEACFRAEMTIVVAQLYKRKGMQETVGNEKGML